MSVDDEQSIKDTFGRGFDTSLGLRLQEVGRDRVVAVLELDDKHHQPFGIVHGGVYCAVAESVASVSAFTWLQATGIGGTAVGVNNNTDFIKSVSAGTISVESSPIHRGRRQQLWRVTMTDDQGRLVAASQVRLQNIELPEGVEVPAIPAGA
ncbi:PaaI family thioesterase [Gordonia sp. SL306]|uniref:PaaI family thioesterase n=1 Tax=Gordonia sp. SL306 TaxID=2995145 RepID=UPI00226E00D2|nr:PaaI family thioesterase [Gordonia sp. SL306]WAC55661.1 PaaI family thioesterase [Gordonia sp. SL306]